MTFSFFVFIAQIIRDFLLDSESAKNSPKLLFSLFMKSNLTVNFGCLLTLNVMTKKVNRSGRFGVEIDDHLLVSINLI